MESLVRIPFSHVVHFLETLSKNGVPNHLVLRYRMDPKFAERASKLLITEYLENPGEKFVIEVNRSLSRTQLNNALLQRGFTTLGYHIINGLEPKTVFSNSSFPNLKPNSIEKMEVFLVSLHKDLNDTEAATILDALNLKSVETEEALTFALQTRALSQDYTIVTLSAKEPEKEGTPKKNFLSLGITMGGYSMISLWHYDFSPETRFLVKRKKPCPEKES